MDIFSYIGDVLGLIWSFITNTLYATRTAFSFIQQSITLPVFLIPRVPTFISSCIIIVLALGVVKLILGWSGE